MDIFRGCFKVAFAQQVNFLNLLITSCLSLCMLRFFDCIDICKVRAGWEEIRLLGTLQPLCSLSCVLLTVLEPTEAEFTLFQEGQR